MFTGIVETIGTVSALEIHDATSSGGGGTSLTISDCSDILNDAHLGDSISINGTSYPTLPHPANPPFPTGTCLTITSLTPSAFKVGISPETLRRTNLSSLTASSPLNLERAVSASTRMGGHFVQGHVDTVAGIVAKTPDGNAFTYRLRPRDAGVLRYVVEKGYVTLDGASLTVTRVEDGEGWFEVMLIAYTQERVVMGGKGVGEEVNVEVDMVGKYVEKSVRGYFEGREGGEMGVLEKMVGRMVEERLKGR
ncbi:Riboflavin synthase alpha chain [Xylographa soralifera]|nr:Riboflavin synthase alpha chain [Xylographa soralifera]